MSRARTAAASVRAWTRAMPTLLRVGAAETLAYRAEFVVWMLTTTLPLVMLGLWTSVADQAPFGRFTSQDFVAYYLAAMIVRNVTGSWIIWQLNDEIRIGTLSLRLLRPVHPFVTYAALHLSAIPLRSLVAIPIAVILLLSSAGHLITHDPQLLALCGLSLVGAWALTFFTLLLIGAFALFIDKSIALFNVYMGVFAVMSGYLVPLSLLPGWAQTIAAWAPFRYMLSLPVEILLGDHRPAAAAGLVAAQWGWAAVILALAAWAWRGGIRRYEAYGT